MPIQQTPRNYQADLSKVDDKSFLELVDRALAVFSADPGVKASLTVGLSLGFEGMTVTGDVAEVRGLLPEVPAGSRSATFAASITATVNPRKTLVMQANFNAQQVLLQMQNVSKSEADAITHLFTGAFPKLQPTQQPAPERGQDAPRATAPAYLPGAFRPVQMPAPSDRDVFVIMSFDREYRDAYFVAIEPTLKDLGLNPVRVDQIQHNATVTAEIVRQIERSFFIVADLTGERPNVYYEVGYAHRADKEVILAARKGTAVHFDVAAINRIEYADFTELREALRKRVSGIQERAREKKT